MKVVNRIVMAAWELRMVALAIKFPILVLFNHFLIKGSIKICIKIGVFLFRRRDPVWSCKSLLFVKLVCVSLLLFATHCLQMAVQWLPQGFLVATAACVKCLWFSAESCKSHCNGDLRVANAALALNFLVHRVVMAAPVFDFDHINLPLHANVGERVL